MNFAVEKASSHTLLYSDGTISYHGHQIHYSYLKSILFNDSSTALSACFCSSKSKYY